MTKKDKYPDLKKGRRITCLACNEGKVYDRALGWKSCKACKGKGYIAAN